MQVIERAMFVFALSTGVVGGILGWTAHERSAAPRVSHAPSAARAYVEAVCGGDDAYLRRWTGERAGVAPWDVRREWLGDCTGSRYLGAAVDIIGREQHVFALLRGDGTEFIYLVTFGHDGLVANLE